MDFSKYTILLNAEKNFTVNGTDSDAAAVDSTETKTETSQTAEKPATQQQPGGILGFGGTIILYIVIIGGAFYLTSRSQKKKEKAIKDAQDQIKVGDEICTSSGFYGKVVDSNDDTYVIEFGTNKGIRVNVKKSEVFPVKNLEK